MDGKDIATPRMSKEQIADAIRGEFLRLHEGTKVMSVTMRVHVDYRDGRPLAFSSEVKNFAERQEGK